LEGLLGCLPRRREPDGRLDLSKETARCARRFTGTRREPGPSRTTRERSWASSRRGSAALESSSWRDPRGKSQRREPPVDCLRTVICQSTILTLWLGLLTLALTCGPRRARA